jgi:hypothetical protein
MPREKWKLTPDALDPWGDPICLAGEDVEQISVLEILAAHPDSGLEQIAPGVYRSTGPNQPPYTSLSGG